MCGEFCHNMDFDLFLRCLKEARDAIDESEILFLDDLQRGECIFGYIPEIRLATGEIRYVDAPYWIGNGCDVEGGAEFATAEEMADAEFYGERSMRSAWDSVCVLHFGMVPLDVWFEACPFAEDVVFEGGLWKLKNK